MPSVRRDGIVRTVAGRRSADAVSEREDQQGQVGVQAAENDESGTGQQGGEHEVNLQMDAAIEAHQPAIVVQDEQKAA